MARQQSKVTRVTMAAPLAPFVDVYRSRLEELGYTPLTIVSELRQVAHLSRWLEAAELTACDLTGERIDRFLAERSAGGHGPCSAQGLLPLVDVLVEMAILLPEPAAMPSTPNEVLLAAFNGYLLAIPAKRFECNLVTYLNNSEVDALLQACDQSTWTGRRDHAMLVLTIQTGLRISELLALTCSDVTLGTGAHIYTVGKGRKERRTPLVPLTVTVLRAWLAEREGGPEDPLFPTSTGRHLSRDAFEHRIRHYVTKAGDICPSIQSKHVTTHTLRHTAAMRLLVAGVDVTVIALWLGHEQVTTTNIYLHADMTQKERAIARVTPPSTKPGRYHPKDPILDYLDAL